MYEDNINIHEIPLFLQQRLFVLLGQKNRLDNVINFSKIYGNDAISILNLLNTDQHLSFFDFINYRDYLEPHHQNDFFKNILDIFSVIDTLHSYEAAYMHELADLIQAKLSSHLSETVTFFDTNRIDYILNTKLTEICFIALKELAIASLSIMSGNTIPLSDAEKLSVLLSQKLLNSNLYVTPSIFQTLTEFVCAIEICVQQEQTRIQEDKDHKKAFYKAYTRKQENQVMNLVQTTAAVPEIDRTFNLIMESIKRNELPQDLRVCVIGMNEGQRFEGPLFEQLENAGVNFSHIVGVDIEDFSPHLYKKLQQLGTKYVVADFSAEDFDLQEQFDLMLLPWSVLNDLVKIEDIFIAMQKIQKHLTPHGIAVLDIPAPLGEKSPYENKMKQYAHIFNVWGIIQAQFTYENESFDTLLNIIDPRKLFTLLSSSGLLSRNIQNLEHLQEMYNDIRENEENLTDRGTSNPYSSPFWHLSDRHRITIPVRNAAFSEVQAQTGINQGLLDFGIRSRKR